MGPQKGLKLYTVKEEGVWTFSVKNRKLGSKVTWAYISWRGLNQHYKVKSFTVHSEMRGKILNFNLEAGGVW